MIEYEQMVEAMNDAAGILTDEELSTEEIRERLELAGIDFSDYKRFIVERLHLHAARHVENEIEVDHIDWAKGYFVGATDLFMVGVLAGKEEALNAELKGRPE